MLFIQAIFGNHCAASLADNPLFSWIHVKIFRRTLSESFLMGTSVALIRSYLDRVKRIWYLSPMRAAKVQASLRIRLVSPDPPLLAHTSSESRGTFTQKVRSLAPLNGWACAVKSCNDGMLEDTNSLNGANFRLRRKWIIFVSRHWHRHAQLPLFCLVSNCMLEG